MPTPQPQAPKLIPRQEFLDKVREEVPELKGFSDVVLMNEILKRRPDLRDKVENPLAGDDAAARAQARATARSKSLVDPEFWKEHPNYKRFTTGVLDALPAGGAMLGGSPGFLSFAAAPFSGGTSIPLSAGTMLAGGALGAGAGRGLRDLSAQVLGMEQTSPFQKAKNIGVDASIAALMPGVVEAMKTPISTARMAVGDYGKILPRRLQGWVEPQFLENFARGPKVTRGPVMPDFAPETPTTPTNTGPSQMDLPIPEQLKTPPTPEGSSQMHLFDRTPAGNPPPTNAAPNPTPTPSPTSGTAGDAAKHVVLTKNAVTNVSQHLKKGTKILVKAKDATPDVVREALDAGYTFDGLNDEGHFRFTKVGD